MDIKPEDQWLYFPDTYQISHGISTIYINHRCQSVRTQYPDSAYVEMWLMGIPTAQAKEWASFLGYENPWDHFREHEILHTWLCMKMGYEYSRTLWTVAHEDMHKRQGIEVKHFLGWVNRKKQGMEEWLVTEFQKLIHRHDDSPAFYQLTDRELDPTQLRGEAIEFLHTYEYQFNNSD